MTPACVVLETKNSFGDIAAKATHAAGRLTSFGNLELPRVDLALRREQSINYSVSPFMRRNRLCERKHIPPIGLRLKQVEQSITISRSQCRFETGQTRRHTLGID
jgi:hypothetical protein